MPTVEIAPQSLTTYERKGLAALVAGTEIDQPTLLSLYRFGLAEQTPWVQGLPAGQKQWAPRLTEAGREAHTALRTHYTSRLCCEATVLLDCVCRYSSYCPSGHPDNGCHGTHD